MWYFHFYHKACERYLDTSDKLSNQTEYVGVSLSHISAYWSLTD